MQEAGDGMDAAGTTMLYALIALGVALGLLLAVGLAVALARGGRARRAPLLVALIAALVVTAVGGVGGVAWVGARHNGSPAPVSANLTVFTQSVDCSHVSGSCGLPNALSAVRADTGAVRWEVVEQSPAYIVSAGPLLHDGIVYAYIYPGATATIGTMDKLLLVAWSGRTGVELWRTTILAPCCQAPLTWVAGDNLAVLDTSRTSGTGSDGNPLWSLLLLRASDGARLGVTRLPGRDLPAVVDNAVYQCQPDKTIVAMRVSDGALIWRSLAAASAAIPLVPRCAIMEDGDELLVSMPAAGNSSAIERSYELLALSATTGQTLWRRAPQTSQDSEPLAVGDGVVVLSEGNPNLPTSIVALRASDGSVVWRHPDLPSTPAARGADPQRTAAIGAGLVLVGAGSLLWALRADTGRAVWHITTQHHSFQTIGFAGSVVFVCTRFTGDGSLFPTPFGDDQSYFSARRASDDAPYWQTALDVGGDQAIGVV